MWGAEAQGSGPQIVPHLSASHSLWNNTQTTRQALRPCTISPATPPTSLHLNHPISSTHSHPSWPATCRVQLRSGGFSLGSVAKGRRRFPLNQGGEGRFPGFGKRIPHVKRTQPLPVTTGASIWYTWDPAHTPGPWKEPALEAKPPCYRHLILGCKDLGGSGTWRGYPFPWDPCSPKQAISLLLKPLLL